MIKFACPSCGKRLGVDDRLAGRKGACPKCRGAFVVPKTPSPPPPRLPQQEDTDFGVEMERDDVQIAAIPKVSFTCKKCGAPNESVAVDGVARCEYCDTANQVAAPVAPVPIAAVDMEAADSGGTGYSPVVVNIINAHATGSPAGPSRANRPPPTDVMDKSGPVVNAIAGAIVATLVGALLGATCVPTEAAVLMAVLIFGASFLSRRWTCPECRGTYILRPYDMRSRYRCGNRACGMMICGECKGSLGDSCPRCGNSVQQVTGMK